MKPSILPRQLALFTLFGAALSLSAPRAKAQEAARAAIGSAGTNQVPPANAPLWGDARMDIPAHNAPLPTPDTGARLIYVAPERENGGQSESGVYADPRASGAAPEAPIPALQALKNAPAGSVLVFRGGI